MITKIRVLEIDARRSEKVEQRGFEVLFNFEKVDIEKDEIKIKFSYAVNYRGGGNIKIKGDLTAKEDAETTKKIEEAVKNKKFPPEYMQKIVNSINYFGTTNATIIASVINMAPPIKMPALRFNQKKNEKEKL